MTARSAAVLGTAFHAPRRGRLELLEGALIEAGADGRIARVTPAGAPEQAERIKAADAAGRLTRLAPSQYLIPGLIDLHIHAPQFPQLGKNLHLPLADWLQNCTFPLEARYADLTFAETVYSELVATLIANGTTTAVYFATVHVPASVALAKICLDLGQRAYVGRVAMDNPDQCPEYYRDASTADGLALTRDFISEVRALPGNDGLVQPVVTPRFIPSCTDGMLDGLGRLAADTNTIVQTHCSESDWQHGYVRDRFGQSDTESLAGFGLMERHTVLAHANFISDADMAIIKRQGAGIAHCPLSNYYFSNAVFPLRRALDFGLNVGLGTDISGGHSPSIIDNARQAIAASRALEEGVDPALPASARGRPGTRVDFREAFWLATAGGAEVLGLDAGVFRAGAAFDAVLLDLAAPGSNVRIYDGLDSPEDVLVKNRRDGDAGECSRRLGRGSEGLPVTKGPQFRRATAADTPAIRQLTREAYAKWVPLIGREPLPMAADYDRAVAAHIIDLCERDGELVGLVEMIPQADHLLIENLAVRPGSQGQGLGDALLRHAEDTARARGFAEVRLYTNALFASNIDFYARRGYEDYRRGSVVPGSVTVFMRKALPGEPQR